MNLETVPAHRWGRVLREAAAIPGPVSLLLIVPPAAFVPGDLDDLRRAHGPNVAIVSDDWLTADQWRAALSEGVAPWLGMMN